MLVLVYNLESYTQADPSIHCNVSSVQAIHQEDPADTTTEYLPLWPLRYWIH